MPFDSNFPPDHQDLDAAPFRDQFNGLNDNINNLANQVANLPTVDSVLDTVTAYAARNVDGLGALTLTISNPPTQAQVQAIVNAYNTLLLALKH
jgi:hypothetical protein